MFVPVALSAPRLLLAPAALSTGVLAACLLAAFIVAPGARAASSGDNPLLTRSPLPFEYPQFDRIKPEHFLPAYEITMAEHLRTIDAIANSPEAPTFENTIVALERSGQDFGRVSRTFGNLVGAHANDELRAVEKTMAPKLAAHGDAIRLNARLFTRIDAIYQQLPKLNLDAESARLVDRYYKDFVRAGAKLAEPDKEKLRQMNQELAALETTFAQNVQKESNAGAIIVTDKAQLAGMSAAEIAATEAAAKAAKKPGQYVINLVNTTGQPPVGSLENRALRQKIQEASLARCSRGGEFDNRAIISQIARLRAERSQLLGFQTYADFALAEQTAGSVATVNKLLSDLAVPAVANARREAADIQALIDADKGGFKVASWDWDFYSEKVRQARYKMDESQLKPYLEMNRVLTDGLFYAANKLYGLTFKERHDLPVYEPTVRVFDVFNADGSQLAIFLADYYARASKRGGAWMNAYMSQSGLLGTKPVIANHLNVPKPADGQPTLLTFDEVTTMFHEFGHALHGMFSDVRYPRFAGTQVPRDFVEFPSQVNEMWATWPEVVKHYAKHYQTGEPMPAALLEKLLATQKFNQGYKTTEYLAASLLDQAWHQLTPAQVPNADGVLAFEAEALRKAGVDFAPVPPRYRSAYFVHVFRNGYSAGYYSYIWAEVLDADAVEWFKANGGLTRANGDHLRQTVLSRGGSAEAKTLYQSFAGREPSVKPLLQRRGLDAAADGAAARE
ncbi:M3 family metallopeptidase [Opitutus sp. ER46]|uniref:M3 family metallopeptidase n=1 Tax=Opitutus sp. ER46 TaxID=2161864 RepID=UPI000D315AA0|nr:M3 family metallopeptidase [Opitutus sp. ER46]PTX97830.1 dipeptidyl carboxypeptidase II [Opitutus sp. ER46]